MTTRILAVILCGGVMRDVIATPDGPQAIGPYSAAIKADSFVCVAGQVAIDPANQQLIAGDVNAQTDRVIKNPSRTLKAGGSGLERRVRSTVFHKNMTHFGAMNELNARYFASQP